MNPDFKNKIEKYFGQRPEIAAAYIFGSYAKSKENKNSDIDIAVLLEYDAVSSAMDLKKEYIIELARLLRKDLHIVILNTAGESLLAQVFRYGECIINQNPSTLAHFKMFSHAMIAEFSYCRSIMEKGFINTAAGADN